MKKLIVAALLISAFAMTAVACDNGDAKETTGDTSATSETVAASAAESTAETTAETTGSTEAATN